MTLVSKFRRSSGWDFCTSANCCAAVLRMSWVLPVSRSLGCRQSPLSDIIAGAAERLRNQTIKSKSRATHQRHQTNLQDDDAKRRTSKPWFKQADSS